MSEERSIFLLFYDHVVVADALTKLVPVIKYYVCKYCVKFSRSLLIKLA